MFRDRERKLRELKDNTNVDANSMHEVADEATMHLVEHFNPAIGSQYKQDYCFTMCKVFLGTEKADPSQDVHAAHVYMAGDIHEWSHDLADLMASDPDVQRFVFHALEIYALKKATGR